MKDIQELSEPSLQPFYKPEIIPKKFTLKRKTSIVYKTPAERLFSATSGQRAMSPRACYRKHNSPLDNPTEGSRPSTDTTGELQTVSE